jgi:hypothetical protein
MVHNLGELVFLEQLCGFCCFSMYFAAIIKPVTVAYVSSFITHSTCCYLFHHPIDCISTVSRHRTRQTYPYAIIDHDSAVYSVQVPYSDSSSVTVSSAASSIWQASKWYLNTSCVVIAWQMSHLANRPQNSSSDKPGFLIRPILSIFFHLVCLGIIMESGSVRSNNVCQFLFLLRSYKLTSYGVGSL